jgi:choline dehydrogenase-like flavoprotein
MLLNWPDLETRQNLVDVVVVGAGAAGLTFADALIGSGLSVLVLEAGRTQPTRADREPLEGSLADAAAHPWLHHYRLRAAGGASRIWGGRCVPFDPIDFEARPWTPGPGWPFGLSELTPYYERAQVAAEAGVFDYDPGTALPGRPAALAPGLDGPLIRTTLERFSRPTDFFRRFLPRLRRDPHVHLLTQAPVTAVRLTRDGRSVDHLEVLRPDREVRRLRARRYVLATGGLETVRLLLASDDVKGCGVGGDSGRLGRYYMCHLAATAGVIRFRRPQAVAYDYERDAEGVYVRRRIALTAQAQRKIGGLNTIFRTHLPDPADPSHGDAILSAMFLVKDAILAEYSRRMREVAPTLEDRLAHIGNVVADPVRLARFAQDWVRRRTLANRKLPSVVLGSTNGVYALEFNAEQAPNPDSRITLTDARDSQGMRRLHVDWRSCELDMLSLERSYALLASELARSGAGELDYTPGEPTEAARKAGALGGHHLGGARMSRSPKDGVVDPHCRVHGLANLYLATSAVFPTSSQANPTLTILALSLRLADRLCAELTGVAPRAATRPRVLAGELA